MSIIQCILAFSKTVLMYNISSRMYIWGCVCEWMCVCVAGCVCVCCRLFVCQRERDSGSI